MRPYIAFRKRFILPIKFFLEDMGFFHKINLQRKEEVIKRIDELKDELIFALKKNKKDEAKILEVRISELEWIIYGNSKEEKHR